ncbi:MAG: hypothetical protein ACO24B_01515 [Ilumatobacteraceae bacterium]
MTDETLSPTDETIDNVEKVENPEAVLKKNRELLKRNHELARQLAELKPIADKAKDFDFDSAQRALEETRRAEEEKLAKKGDFETLLQQKSKAYEERIETERREKEQIYSTLKQEKLALELIAKGVLPDRVHYLVKEMNEQVELGTTETGFVLRKKGGIGDADEFNALVEEMKSRSPFFFGASLSPGTGGQASTGTAGVSARKWSDLSAPEKARAIRDAGGDIDVAKKKFQ